MNRSWWTPTLLAACIIATTATYSRSSWAAGASVDEADWRQRAEANRRFRQGKNAFDAGKYEAALKGFRRSYNIVASPNSHLMIARSMIKLGRKLEAYSELDAVIVEAEAAKNKKKYGKTAEAARGEQEQLESELAFVTVEMGTSASINQKPITPEQWGQPIALQPGTYEVVVSTKTTGEERKKLNLKPGEKVTISPTPLRPKPATVRPSDSTSTTAARLTQPCHTAEHG